MKQKPLILCISALLILVIGTLAGNADISGKAIVPTGNYPFNINPQTIENVAQRSSDIVQKMPIKIENHFWLVYDLSNTGYDFSSGSVYINVFDNGGNLFGVVEPDSQGRGVIDLSAGSIYNNAMLAEGTGLFLSIVNKVKEEVYIVGRVTDSTGVAYRVKGLEDVLFVPKVAPQLIGTTKSASRPPVIKYILINNGQVIIGINADKGTYNIQGTSDFMAWKDVKAFTLVNNGNIEVVLPAENPQYFYRVRG